MGEEAEKAGNIALIGGKRVIRGVSGATQRRQPAGQKVGRAF